MSINLFDPTFYRLAYSDLAALNDEQLQSHFLNYGLSEGRRFSPLVDLDFYQLANPDLAAAGLTTPQQLLEHLQTFGVTEGRSFSPLVDLDFYIATNPDIAQAFGGDRIQSLQHLIAMGLNEQRSFSPLFDLEYYAYRNPDLAEAGLSGQQLLEHFELFGISENRHFSLVFDPEYYRDLHPDLAAAGLNARQLLEHFQLFGIQEGRAASPFFDTSYYLAENDDLTALNLTNEQAIQHFVTFGLEENRSATPATEIPISQDPIGIEPYIVNNNAFDLGVVSGRIEFSESIKTGDQYDDYRFTLDVASQVNLSFSELSLGPYTAAGLRLVQDKNGDGFIHDFVNNELISNGSTSVFLEAGDYFIQVSRMFAPPDGVVSLEPPRTYALFGGLNHYTLDLSATPVVLA